MPDGPEVPASAPMTCSRVLTTSAGCVNTPARLAEPAEHTPSTQGGSRAVSAAPPSLREEDDDGVSAKCDDAPFFLLLLPPLLVPSCP